MGIGCRRHQALLHAHDVRQHSPFTGCFATRCAVQGTHNNSAELPSPRAGEIAPNDASGAYADRCGGDRTTATTASVTSRQLRTLASGATTTENRNWHSPGVQVSGSRSRTCAPPRVFARKRSSGRRRACSAPVTIARPASTLRPWNRLQRRSGDPVARLRRNAVQTTGGPELTELALGPLGSSKRSKRERDAAPEGVGKNHYRYDIPHPGGPVEPHRHDRVVTPAGRRLRLRRISMFRGRIAKWGAQCTCGWELFTPNGKRLFREVASHTRECPDRRSTRRRRGQR